MKAPSNKAPSKGEALLWFQMNQYGLFPEREYRFDEVRRYRADFAFVERGILIEVEGGVWAKGRHNSGSGYTGDCQKYNLAALRGWAVYRFTTAMVESGEAIDWIRNAIAL